MRSRILLYRQKIKENNVQFCVSFGSVTSLLLDPWVHTPHEMKGVFPVRRDRGHKMDVADPDVEERRRRWRPNGYWELVEGENEDRILDELELGSIAPQRRNFRFLTSRKRASARVGTLDYSSARG